MIIRFSDRSFSKPLYFPLVQFEVKRMEWDMEGGPSTAVIQAGGEAGRLAQLAQLLRCEVVISDDNGGPVWWGYVHGFRAGRLSISLDDLYNRVAVRYRDERSTESVMGGWQYQTAWAEDAQSVAEYGKKELIVTQGEAQTSEATALAAAELERRRRPGWNLTTNYTNDTNAILELRGWWSTLGWTYFAESRGREGFSGGGSTVTVGNAAAQRFTTGASGWSMSGVWGRAAIFGAPAGVLQGQLRADSGGPAGTTLATGDVATADLRGEVGWVKAVFSSAYSLAASTNYWVVWIASGGSDASNYFRLAVDEGLPYAGGIFRQWNGSSWAARSPDADMPFIAVGQDTSTNQILTMASAANGGQFLSGIFIKDGSTVQARLYRQGSLSALEEIREMLALGTSSGGRLMGWITEGRVLVVESVPVAGSATAEYLIKASGEACRLDGGPAAVSSRMVGKWARLEGLDQAGGDLGPAGGVLIRRAVWQQGRVKVEWE